MTVNQMNSLRAGIAGSIFGIFLIAYDYILHGDGKGYSILWGFHATGTGGRIILLSGLFILLVELILIPDKKIKTNEY